MGAESSTLTHFSTQEAAESLILTQSSTQMGAEKWTLTQPARTQRGAESLTPMQQSGICRLQQLPGTCSA